VNIDRIDRSDLQAVATLFEWGYNPKKPRMKLSPCPRPNCKGSIVALWGDSSCLLCARGPGGTTEPEWAVMLEAASRQIKP
jgi:hypothetical protein